MFKGLLKDTSLNIKAINAGCTFPFIFQKRDRMLCAALPLLVILLATPPWNLIPLSQGYENRRAVALVSRKLQDEAQKLEHQAAANPESREEIKKKAADVRKLARDLKGPGVSKKEAIARISSLSDKYRQEKLSKTKEALEKMNAAVSGKQDGRSARNKALSEKMREMARKCLDRSTTDREMRQLKEDISRLKDAAGEKSALKKDLEQALSDISKKDHKAAAKKLDKSADDMQNMERAAQCQKSNDELCRELSSCKSSLSGGNDSSGEELSQEAQAQNTDGAEETAQQQNMNSDSDGKEGKGKAKETGEITKNYKVTEKKGDAEADFGKGTTNREQKAEKTPQDTLLRRQSERQGHWKEFYDRIYESRREKFDSAITHAKGQSSGSRGTLSTSETKGGIPSISPQGSQPGSLYSEYRSRAEETVNREKIPGEYKKFVRSYFKEIDPDR